MVLASAPPPTKASYNNNNEGNWSNNMAGYLLVFFHQQNHNNDNDDELDDQVSSTPTTKILKRRSSCSLSPSHCSPLKNTSVANNYSNNALTLLSKTQSTLSVCALLFFATVLIFSLSTFEPATSAHHAVTGSRRLLRQVVEVGNDGSAPPLPPALQGMGELYTRGSKAMTDLIVGHVAEGAEEREVRSFLRLLHHSGALSKSDLVLVFDSPDSVSRIRRLVKYECDSFSKLVELYKGTNATRSGLTRYLRPVGEDEKEAIWGAKSSYKGVNLTNSGESTRTSYGSVVSFDASELDPENSLSGFLDRIPMSIRRFACYPMLLGRLRRHYKHTVLVDVSNSLVLSDPFTRVRNRSSESVVLWTESAESTTTATRRTRRSSAPRVDPRVIVGGARGVRRFATSALIEIVRAAVEHKGGKGGRVGSVTEAGLVSQLVHSSGQLLKNVNVVTVPESIPEASSLAGFNSLDSKGSGSGFLAFSDYFSVVRRGGGGGSVDIDSLVRREICSSHELYSSVYRDCFTSK